MDFLSELEPVVQVLRMVDIAFSLKRRIGNQKHKELDNHDMESDQSAENEGIKGIQYAGNSESTGAPTATAPSTRNYVRVNEPKLASFDHDNDGILSIAELQAVAATFPNDAKLQSLVTREAADPNFKGIQYDGNCDLN